MTPGQAAYEKWNELIPPSNRINVEWADLPDSAREGWEEVGKSVISTKEQKMTSREKDLKAADELENLIPYMKEIVNVIRDDYPNPGDSYALIYDLRYRIGKIVATLGFDVPSRRRREIAKQVFKEQTQEG